MGELVIDRIQVWEVTEVGTFGRRVVRGVFSSEAEAWARYDALCRQEPNLAQSGSIGVGGRTLEVPRDAANPTLGRNSRQDAVSENAETAEKMRRVGRDGYEDKAIGAHKADPISFMGQEGAR